MDLHLIAARKEEHLYSVDHRGEYFYIHTNDQGKNFRIAQTKLDQFNTCDYKSKVIR